MITQGTFSFLPPLDSDELEAQLRYALDRGWAISVELTDDPHPRNTFWELWGLPMFELTDPRGVLTEVDACCDTFPNHYVKVERVRQQQGPRDHRHQFHRPAPGARARLPHRSSPCAGSDEPVRPAFLCRRSAAR